MSAATILILAFAIGLIAGLRSLTAPAAVCWAAHLGWINLQHSFLAFMGTTPATYIFSALALAEIVNDKLPKTPSRKAPTPFTARIVMGAVSGLALCLASGQSPVLGAILGGLGGVVGTYVGYELRTRLVKALNVPDLVIALLEDIVAVGGAFFIVSRF